MRRSCQFPLRPKETLIKLIFSSSLTTERVVKGKPWLPFHVINAVMWCCKRKRPRILVTLAHLFPPSVDIYR
ncbi:hypothetical protein HN51_027960 [Arachis hypogaea]